METLRLALAQINPTVGDLRGNRTIIARWMGEARRQGAALVVFPELAVTGYPPEDLLLKPHFVEHNLDQLTPLAHEARGLVAVVGFVDVVGDRRYNAAAVLAEGKVAAVYHKRFLPNYGVFDEQRYFTPGESLLTFFLGGAVFGITICEDIWHPEMIRTLVRRRGAQVIITLNASPYHAQKWRLRETLLAPQAQREQVVIGYVNLVGGQDELVFDGGSMILDITGRVVTRARPFQESLLLLDLGKGGLTLAPHKPPPDLRPPPPPPFSAVHRLRSGQVQGGLRAGRLPPAGGNRFTHLPLRMPQRRIEPRPLVVPEPHTLSRVQEVYEALVLGTRDYVRKNGFQKVVIGLSGGVDSALTATLAVDALGKDNVVGVFLPSRYSSQASGDDARQLARQLGIHWKVISIEPAFRVYRTTLGPTFKGHPADITEENLQARIRGNLLMALSNKFGWLVLTTGNKSEMGVGYATLYGDMAGGFAVIKDVPKTLVYQLARFRNHVAGRALIPERVLEKAPTAELRAHQTDQDTLPPYEVLDGILRAYVEEDKGCEDIVALGYAKATARRVLQMVDRSEYKRRQAPPGIKITPKAFGKDRRMPITNHFRE